MAPKRKSVLSRNPFPSKASTSSDPTPSYVQFRDEKAKMDFFENFQKCGVHLELLVILMDFVDTLLLEVIWT